MLKAKGLCAKMCSVTYSHTEGDQEGEGDAGNKSL